MAGRNPSILAVGFKDGGATDADFRNETVAEIGGWAQLVPTVEEVAAPNSAPVTAPNPTPPQSTPRPLPRASGHQKDGFRVRGSATPENPTALYSTSEMPNRHSML